MYCESSQNKAQAADATTMALGKQVTPEHARAPMPQGHVK